MKFKLTMIMAAVVTSVVVIVCVLNTFFLDKYYIREQEKSLISSYVKLSEMIDSDSAQKDVLEEIHNLNSLYNINVFVLDSNWDTDYSSQGNNVDAAGWLQDFMFSGNQNIVEENDAYTLQEGTDTDYNMTYLAIYGTIDQGSVLVMQVVIESIEETVSVCNRFVILVGLAALIISIVAVYLLAGRFTKPIQELSSLAGQMSEMNFEAKYKGEDKGEIGLLGTSMNTMSDKLEKNISDLKTANLALQRDIELRDRNEAMRREFSSNVSHELKTPIALIQGYAEGLKEGVNDDPESRDYYCDVIIDEAHKMNHLVKNLLMLNQLEYGNELLEMERFDLGELIRSIAKANQIRAEEKKASIETVLPESCFAWGDELQIEEVITNYLSNAINHCRENGSIRIWTEQYENKIRVNVFNTGDRIPEESLPKLWEKFYKVDKARTRAYGGNGIGLSIVKAIMDNHHGEYGAVNQPEGVIFYFVLDCK